MTTIAFDPAYKDALITLFGNGFTAQGGASLKSVLASAAQTGDFYYEYQAQSLGAESLFGIANDSAALTTSIASNTNGIGVNNQSGADVYYNGATIGTAFSSWGDGNIIGCAVSTSAAKIWFLKNGTWYGGSGGATPVGQVGGFTLGVSGSIRPGYSMTGGYHAISPGNFPPFLGGASLGDGAYPSGYTGFNTGLSAYTAGVSSLNPSELSTQAVLTQSNLRLLGTGGVSGNFQLCVGTKAVPNSSRAYWEFRIDAANFVSGATATVGIRRSGGTLDNAPIDSGVNRGIAYYASGGAIKNNGTTLATITAAQYVGSIIGIAVDRFVEKIWFSIDGVWDGDPVAKTGGYSTSGIAGAGAFYAAVGVEGSHQTNSVGCNFGGYSFQYSIPSGFVSLDDAVSGGVGRSFAFVMG